MWRKQLSELIEFDASVLALVKPVAPRPDMFLLLDGVARKRLLPWCEDGFRRDGLLQKTLTGQSHRQSEANGLLAGHTIAVARLACPQQSVWWWLALSRRSKPFTEAENFLVTMLLRTIAARFEFPSEALLSRIVLDGAFELLHVDTATCVRLLDSQTMLAELKALLPQLIAQRWDKLDDHDAHSAFVSLDGQPVWVQFRRGRAADADSRNWHLELRPLDPDDPPAVGLVEDPRVARALGFLTDQFQHAPSLAKVAECVKTSPFHFHRLFTRQTGVSPKHFLLRTQLMHAKQMLRATPLPIGDIASATGFSSHGHFTATFNRLVGQSPSEYREHA